MSTSVDMLPEIQTFINMEREKNHQTDSKYTRFVRRKFQCIVIFLILFMTLLEFFNVLIPKLDTTNMGILNNFLHSVLNNTSNE